MASIVSRPRPSAPAHYVPLVNLDSFSQITPGQPRLYFPHGCKVQRFIRFRTAWKSRAQSQEGNNHPGSWSIFFSFFFSLYHQYPAATPRPNF
ncbi:hypothetical protein LMH87_005310 [Akanthomyces muscarius]|uniref:Uncharacterized protein n=1 Tax=Akanthomyces muscarius TaxID=2231603 RepID=A0A9W8QLK2_AKAMU|nr:hypothetical protein LMH87_005310 [Akanthomyces muscarius]KAJ4163590.1 hypothetical protein LMH87_005310 [Akanthomyces muscarius]